MKSSSIKSAQVKEGRKAFHKFYSIFKNKKDENHFAFFYIITAKVGTAGFEPATP